MQGKRLDLVGKKFGRLTVLEQRPSKKSGGTMWLCCCDCGNEKVVIGYYLGAINPKTGKQRVSSCGCYTREQITAMSTTHGAAIDLQRRQLYRVWTGIRNRCLSPANRIYKNYGGRGITIASEWLDFAVFEKYTLEVLGPKPGPGFSIDREDNERGYEPGNLRWATAKEQRNNQRQGLPVERRCGAPRVNGRGSCRGRIKDGRDVCWLHGERGGKHPRAGYRKQR